MKLGGKKRALNDGIRWRNTLRWRLTLFVFAVIVFAGLLTAAVCITAMTVFRRSWLASALMVNPFVMTAVLLCVCAIIGTLLTGFLGKYYLKPLKQLIAATKEVKKGNFKVHLDTDGNPQTEMEELIHSFNEMSRELDGIEMFRNDFINNFSHEFKTPIVSICGFAKQLEIEDLTPEQRLEYAKIIAEESDRLAKLATNVLELSRLENQQIVTDKQEFYLDEQLRQCILLQESLWTEKEIEIIPELDEVKLFSNEELLSHIWLNLIGNAIKFTPKGGTVHVGLKERADSVTVMISDTGIGMSDEIRSHIFEKFYQGDPSHHKSGYGIGLTMAHRAAVLCGGSIAVESTTGKGSTFSVTLPK